MEKLRDGDLPEWATTLQTFSEQRAGFHREIVALGHERGDDVDESGSPAASPARGMDLAYDALTGDDAGSVLGARAECRRPRGVRYESALEQDLSASSGRS